MGTKLTAKSFYLELEEVPTFSRLTSTGIKDDTASVFNFAEQYADHVSASQQQTIERLRDLLSQAVEIYKSKDAMIISITKLGLVLDDAEQLLNTTEPIDQ